MGEVNSLQGREAYSICIKRYRAEGMGGGGIIQLRGVRGGGGRGIKYGEE